MTDRAVAGPGLGATLGRCRIGWMKAPWAAAPTPRVTIAVPTHYLCVLLQVLIPHRLWQILEH